MSNLQDFFVEDFAEVEVIERDVKIGGKVKKMQFKPISAALGDEIKKSCRKTKIYKGAKQIDFNQDLYMAKLITETTVHPDFKNAELQKNWGVMGAVELLEAMKTKMLDGEFTELSQIVTEVNGYERTFEDKVDEIKN